MILNFYDKNYIYSPKNFYLFGTFSWYVSYSLTLKSEHF